MVDFNSRIDLSKLANIPLEFSEDDNSPFIFDDPLVNTSKKTKIEKKSESILLNKSKNTKVNREEIPTYIPKKKNNKPSGVEALSAEDKKYIDDNARKYSVDEIAEYLNKKRSTVFRYMDKHNLLGEEDRRDARDKKKILNALHNEAFWNVATVKSYNEEELAYFEEEWYNFVIQLDDNITATERMSLRSLIENQISMDRLAIKEYKVNQQIEELEEKIRELQRQLEHISDDEEILIQREIATLSSTQMQLGVNRISIGKDRDNLMKAQSKIMQDLDVTRARRVEKHDVSDKTWARMLMEIKENPRLKKQMGAMAYLSMLAVERMRGRLTQPRQFADGEFYSPMLLPEGIVNKELMEMAETLFVPRVEEDNQIEDGT